MRAKNNCAKLMAWLLVFAMMLSLVVMPSGMVEAETITDPSQIGTTSSDVTVVLEEANHDGGYYQYTVTVNNNSSNTVSDWLVVVPVSGISGSTDWSGDWARVKWSYSTEYMYITSRSGETIPSGGSLGGEAYKIQYTGTSALSISQAKVYYKNGSSSTGAFDAVLENVTKPSGGGGGNVEDFTGDLTYTLPSDCVDDAEKTPFSEHGKLHVDMETKKLTDQNGNPFQLRGLSTHGINWADVGYPYVNFNSFKNARDIMNANAIRLAMYTTEYYGYADKGTCEKSQDYVQKDLKYRVDKGVKCATALGMYAIVDWHILHDKNPQVYKAEAKEYFAYVSKLYKDYDNILYEICNEPNGGTSWTDIKTYAEEIIPIIRANDPDAIIIVGTPTWSQEVDKPAADPIKDANGSLMDNVMYTIHFYADTHDSAYRDVVKAAEGKIPIFCTEFGMCNSAGEGTNNFTEAKSWLDYFDQACISYFVWSMSIKETASLFISGGADNWTVANLSESGQWINEQYEARKDINNVSVTTEKQNNTHKADMPELAKRTDKKITVNAAAGVEYSLDKNNWNTDGIFDGLTPFTKYTIYARDAETDEKKAGVISEPLLVYTLVEDPYIIDVSKFSGTEKEAYLDVLRESETESATINYDSIKKELTLVKSGEQYTLTGNNPDLTVKVTVGVGKITMKNAVIGALDVSDPEDTSKNAEVDLVVTGNNQIACGNTDNATSGVVMQTGDKITVSGEGSLKIDKADEDNASVSGGTFVVEGGNITVEGAISTDSLSVNGGSLDAASGIECSGDVAINGGTVKAPSIKVSEEGKIVIDPENANIVGDIADIFSKPPVDDEGKEIKIFTIKYVVETGSQTVRKNEGAGYTIDQEPPLKAGYTVTWIGSDGKAYKKGDVINVTGDITFKATYSQIMVSSVKISVPKTTLSIGDSVKASVAVMPENALDRDVDWSSSNMQVVTVNENGVITANAAGTATITATASDGSEKTDAVSITVAAANTNEGIAQDEDIIEATSMDVIAKVKGAEGITVKSAYKLAVKKTMQLAVTFMPVNAEKEELSYTSSKHAVATISDSGMVTAKKAGTTTITIKAANGLTKTFKLQVMSKPVTKVKITGAKTSMKVKGTMKLKAVTSPNKSVASNNVCWTSSNTKIAIVDANGKVKALKKGTVKITVAVTDGSGKKATVKIKVK